MGTPDRPLLAAGCRSAAHRLFPSLSSQRSRLLISQYGSKLEATTANRGNTCAVWCVLRGRWRRHQLARAPATSTCSRTAFAAIPSSGVRRTLVTSWLGLLTLFVASAGSVVHADSVDSYFRAQMAKEMISGLSLAVIRDGHVVKEASYGLASVELKAPLTLEISFGLASMTKIFTAAAIMRLVQEGRLTLGEPVARIRLATCEYRRPSGVPTFQKLKLGQTIACAHRQLSNPWYPPPSAADAACPDRQ